MTTGPRTLTEWLAVPRDAREAALACCLERIRALEPAVHAWVQIAPRKPTGDGPLQGIPFGSKDIIELGGLATEYGSPIYEGRLGSADAAVVRDLRSRGAVIVGNTRCAAFAYRTPPPTRNPRAPEHTPGGSSSGAAAAVAAGMVPFALGTQTLGSILRPASYCGVTGFKPTFGLVSTGGVLPFARSLDTVGFFTHAAADMLALWQAMGRPTGRHDEQLAFAVPDPIPHVEPAMADAFGGAVRALRAAGVSIHAVDIAGLLAEILDAATVVMFYEGARFHRERFEEHGDALRELADLVREGLQISDARYHEAARTIAGAKTRFSELYRRTPVVLVPAAPGAAPRGLTSTGDARMNAPWTALGTPAISIPIPVGDGLPLGLQLTADRDQDARLLRAAMRAQTVLGERG
ncbi:MAG: amidase [Betaproteobacteria bacterium]